MYKNLVQKEKLFLKNPCRNIDVFTHSNMTCVFENIKSGKRDGVFSRL